jgi:O-antigen ligase
MSGLHVKPPPRLPVEVAAAARPTVRLTPAWPVYALLYGYPLWYVLGLQAFIWPLLAVPMAANLLRRRLIRVPRAFWLWALFLVCVAVSAMGLDDLRRMFAFVYRGSLYLSATILLLFIVNLSPQALPLRRLAKAAAFLWFVVILGGFAGLLFPGLEFSTLTAAVLPSGVANDPFVKSLVRPEVGDVSTLLGYELPRPKAPFNYTNEWGSNLGLLTFFAVYFLHFIRRRGPRLVLMGMLFASLAPIILSINRGLWLSLVVGFTYVGLRLGFRGHGRAFAGVLVALAVAVFAIVFTPLGQVILDRAERSNIEGRQSLYEHALGAALDSPILGHGAPLPSEEIGVSASVGTHGQFWTLLVSQGIPGALLFVGFLGATLCLTWRVAAAALWIHAVLLVALLQMLFYNLLPVQIHLVMIAIAICGQSLLSGRGSHRTAPAPALSASGGHR